MESQNKEKKPSKLMQLKLLPKNNWLKVLLFADLIVSLIFMVMLTLVDAFPKKAVAAILVLLLGMLIMSALLLRSRKKKNTERVIGNILSAIMIISFGIGSFYLGSAYAMFNRISVNDIKSSGVDITKKPFNVYITGIDHWAGEEGMDLDRSDVNMIMTVNPQTKTILLTSMPRDSYVALHKNGAMDKLTHTGIYGVKETLNTVSDWFGIDFDYYVKVNFSTLVTVVDAIGGIDVHNDIEFNSWIREDFNYPVGDLHLDGLHALYFARERKSFEDEDEKRIANQQKVLKAILDKCMSSKTILLHYTDLLDAVGDNMTTNMSPDQMNAFVKMQLQDLGKWTIKQQAVTGTDAERTVASMSSENTYFVSIPDQDSVDACIKGIEEVMNPPQEEIDKIQKERKASKQKDAAKNFVKKKKK